MFVTSFEGNQTSGSSGSDIFIDVGKNSHTGGADADIFVFSVGQSNSITGDFSAASNINDFNTGEDYIYVVDLNTGVFDSDKLRIQADNTDTMVGYQLSNEQVEWFARLKNVNLSEFQTDMSTIFNPGASFNGFAANAIGTNNADIWIGSTSQAGQFAGGSGNDVIGLIGPSKSVSGGAGSDQFAAYVSPAQTSANELSIISDFQSDSDHLTLVFGEAVNPRGQEFGQVDFSTSGNLPAGAAILVDTGDVQQMTLEVIKARLDNITNLSAGDEFLYVADDNTNTTIFTYQDDNTDGVVQLGEIDPVVVLSGVESTAINSTNLDVIVG